MGLRPIKIAEKGGKEREAEKSRRESINKDLYNQGESQSQSVDPEDSELRELGCRTSLSSTGESIHRDFSNKGESQSQSVDPIDEESELGELRCRTSVRRFSS